jgi:general secretion pathway protein A
MLCSFIRQQSRYCGVKLTAHTSQLTPYRRSVYICDSPVRFGDTIGAEDRRHVAPGLGVREDSRYETPGFPVREERDTTPKGCARMNALVNKEDLADLDRGMGDERSRQLPPPARSARPSTPPVAAKTVRRQPLDLFSPDMFVPDPGPPTTASAFPPDRQVRPVPDRRPIPFVDGPPEIDPRIHPSQISDPLTRETSDGLHEHPFSLSSDPRFLYHSVAHDRAAQAMLDAIRRRDGIVVLTGEVGVGKTILCRAVVEQLDRRTLTSLISDPFDGAEDLLKTVLVDFGVISRDDVTHGRLARASLADLSAALRDFLFSLAPLQAFAVVIVDEAQRLPVELLDEIRAVAELGGDEQLLQVMLVGRPALSATLAKPELRQLVGRVSARASLGPLASDEVAGYVTHRLGIAGMSPHVEFDDPSVARLYELSGGVPRTINLLCDRALALGQAASSGTIDEWMVDSAAEDLDLAPPASRSSLVRMAVTVAVLAMLGIIGAAAGAFVFRTDVSALISRWQAAPAPPAEPRPALARPYEPAPPSAAEQQVHP